MFRRQRALPALSWDVEDDVVLSEAPPLRGARQSRVIRVTSEWLGTMSICAALLALVAVLGWEYFGSPNAVRRRGASTFQSPDKMARHIRFAPDGSLLAIGCSDGSVQLRDSQTGELRRTLAGHPRTIRSLAFSPDGKTLVTGGGDGPRESGELFRWNIATGERESALWWHSCPISAVAFAPDGRQMAAASEDGLIEMWDTSSWTVGCVVQCDRRDAAMALAFADNGETLLAAKNDGAIQRWNSRTGVLIQRLAAHQGVAWTALTSPNGQLLATAGEENFAKLWNGNGELIHELPVPTWHVRAMTFTADGRTLIAGGGQFREPGWLAAYDVDSGIRTALLTAAHRNLIYSIDLSPDGSTLATGSGDETVKFWDPATLQVKLSIPLH